MADNGTMNRLILASAGRGAGLAGRLGDVDTRQRRAALNDALSAAERAIKHGDDVARGIAEARIDTVLAEARAARQEPQHEPEATFGFDGGVRGRRGPRPTPGVYAPTAGQLFVQALTQSRAERAEQSV